MFGPQLSLPWISYVAGSLVSPSASPACDEASATSGGSGPPSPKPSKQRRQKSLSPKTCLDCGRPGCATCWPTLPLSGSMRSGRVSARSTSALRISDDVSSSLLPTPAASTYGTNRGGSAGRSNQRERPSLETLLSLASLQPRWRATRIGGGYRRALSVERILASATLPTPTLCGDWNQAGASPTSGDGLAVWVGTSLTWREWMMGFPCGWARLARPTATRCAPSGPRKSAKRSSG